MNKSIYLLVIIFTLTLTSFVSAEKGDSNELLKSGPMLGYSAMREVIIWVQTTKGADVKIKYWNIKNKSVTNFSESKRTIKEKVFSEKIIIENLEPGEKYDYEIFINDKLVKRDYPLTFQTQKLWQWREDAPNFKFAAGSCFYVNEDTYDRPGKSYGDGFQIFDHIYKSNPDFMIWTGDNTYLREVDWDSRYGILNRYSHTRSFEGIQPLLGNTHNYAAWDDHDYGPDNSDRSYIHKNLTLEAFNLFWGNPTFGVNGNPGTTTYFEWSDCAFFLLDGRWNRSPENRKHNERTILGEDQFEWLIDALVKSEAPFKFVSLGTVILTNVADKESYETYKTEKEKLFAEIKKEKIEGVIFITGDRHYTELCKMEREDAYPIYEFTISPLTSGVSSNKDINKYLVKGTHLEKRNFGLFEISGKRNNRVLKCTVIDKDGNEAWNYSINENELKHKN